MICYTWGFYSKFRDHEKKRPDITVHREAARTQTQLSLNHRPLFTKLLLLNSTFYLAEGWQLLPAESYNTNSILSKQSQYFIISTHATRTMPVLWFHEADDQSLLGRALMCTPQCTPFPGACLTCLIAEWWHPEKKQERPLGFGFELWHTQSRRFCSLRCDVAIGNYDNLIGRERVQRYAMW